MSNIRKFNFHKIYELMDLIDSSVRFEVEFWNYNEDFFINAATRFSKDTLLHQYIATTAYNHFRRDFRKNGDLMDEEVIDDWYALFDTYSIDIPRVDVDDEGEYSPITWYEDYEDQFNLLFERMADEAFHLLFLNRNFLLAFNSIVASTVQSIEIPSHHLNHKGTIKRVSIPQWVKTAVFHRDKGRCVFCYTDLTGLINTLTNKNFDHIVPLDLYGVNDPCNIQLSCEHCNKSKTNKEGATSNHYMQWWSQ